MEEFEIEIRKNKFWFKVKPKLPHNRKASLFHRASFLLTAFVICLCVGMGVVSSLECDKNLFNGNGSACSITSSLTLNGTYLININDSYSIGAISFLASNIFLDCNNSVIYGNGTFVNGYYGVSSIGRNNVEIRNCHFKNYYRGANLKNGLNVRVYNSTFENNLDGFYLENVNGGYFKNLNSTNSSSNNFVVSVVGINITVDNFISKNSLGSGFSINNVTSLFLTNSSSLNSVDSGIIVYGNSNIVNITNFVSLSNGINYKFENISNLNLLFCNSSNSVSNLDSGLVMYAGGNNITILNYNSNNDSGHGMAIKYVSNFILKNSVFNNPDRYGIDFYGGGNNILVENNSVYSALDGVVFSMASDSFGTNAVSRNNRIYNVRDYGIYFNGITNGLSEADYILNSTTRCFSASTNNNNISFKNGICENFTSLFLHVSVNSNNVLFQNMTSNILFNNYSFSDSYNLSIKDINYKEYTFINGRNSSVLLYNLTSSLIYYSNGSVACSDISTCNGNINITLSPNNYSFVLDNYNKTEGVTRSNDPITLTSNGRNTVKTITSTLTQTINATTIFNVNDCNINSLTYQGASPSYTCTDEIVTITSPNLVSGTSQFLIVYNGVPADTCSSALTVFQSYPALIGLIGTVFLLGLGILFLVGYNMVKSGNEISNEQVGIFFLTLIGIGLLVIIGIIAIGSVCALGIIS